MPKILNEITRHVYMHESCIDHYTAETKKVRSSLEQRASNGTTPVEAKTGLFAVTVLTTDFWDASNVVYISFFFTWAKSN